MMIKTAKLVILIILLLSIKTSVGQIFYQGVKRDSISSYVDSNYFYTEVVDSFTFFSDKFDDFYIEQGYYENGQMAFEIFHHNGAWDGPVRGWYPDGKLRYFNYYKNGIPTGFSASWYENGNIEYYGCYDTYDSNIDKEIYDSIQRASWDCDTTTIVRPYPPYDVYDTVTCTTSFMKIGKWTECYENGNLKCEEYYRNSQRTGTWNYFNSDGVLIRQERYEDNVLIETIEFE